MRYQAIFFDLDGTLLDTSAGVIKAINHIENEYHLPKLTVDEKRSFIGPPIQDSFQRHYNLSKERAWELATAWRDAYKDIFLLEAVPYDGIFDVLCFCRECGIRTGVATNKREDYTRKLLTHFGFIPLFDCVAGTDIEGKMKKTDLIRVCMEKCELKYPDRCLMVGDTINDMAAANKAGAEFLGVSYGFGFSTADVWSDIPVVNNCGAIIDYLTSSQ